MSVSAVFNALLKVTETLPVGSEAADAITRIHKALAAYTGTSGELTASTTPPADSVWSREITLSAGAATLVMTALAETFNGTTVNKTFLGLKTNLWLFIAHPSNSAPVKIIGGSFDIFGPTVTFDAGAISIPPGGFRFGGDNAGGATVGASQTVTLTSDDADAKVLAIVVAGI